MLLYRSNLFLYDPGKKKGGKGLTNFILTILKEMKKEKRMRIEEG